MTKKHFGVILLLLLNNVLFAQSNLPDYPHINQPCPDYKFYDLTELPQKQASISDFRGKWLFLDFWSIYCGSCVASMPKMNSLQNEFKDKIKIIMVGGTQIRADKNAEAKTKASWDFMKAKYNLALTAAFDSILVERWGVEGLPLIVCIDPKGIVKLITVQIDSSIVQTLLDGNTPKDYYKAYFNKYEKDVNPVFTGNKNYDPDLPFLTTGKKANGGIDTAFLYRSLIAKYHSGQTPINTTLIGYMGNKTISVFDKDLLFEIMPIDLISLYRFAYLGKFYVTPLDSSDFYETYSSYPIVESKDSLNFYKNDIDENLFAYSQILPSGKCRQDRMKVLRNDLNSYFGYDVSIETRVLPVLNLVVKDKQEIMRLKTTQRTQKEEPDLMGFMEKERRSKVSRYLLHQFDNISIKSLINFLTKSTWGLSNKYKLYHNYNFLMPIIDRTGIDFKIDIKIEGLDTDFTAMKAELNRNGLDLVQTEKEMKVLVIKDPKAESIN